MDLELSGYLLRTPYSLPIVAPSNVAIDVAIDSRERRPPAGVAGVTVLFPDLRGPVDQLAAEMLPRHGDGGDDMRVASDLAPGHNLGTTWAALDSSVPSADVPGLPMSSPPTTHRPPQHPRCQLRTINPIQTCAKLGRKRRRHFDSKSNEAHDNIAYIGKCSAQSGRGVCLH